jgi:hypothetical protein
MSDLADPEVVVGAEFHRVKSHAGPELGLLVATPVVSGPKELCTPSGLILHPLPCEDDPQ